MTDELIVSQRARDAAASLNYLSPRYGERRGFTWSAAYLIRRGEWDGHPAVQAFAQLEADTLASQARQIEALRETLEAVAFEAERENGGWVHLKRVIANKARATLEETSRG